MISKKEGESESGPLSQSLSLWALLSFQIYPSKVQSVGRGSVARGPSLRCRSGQCPSRRGSLEGGLGKIFPASEVFTFAPTNQAFNAPEPREHESKGVGGVE